MIRYSHSFSKIDLSTFYSLVLVDLIEVSQSDNINYINQTIGASELYLNR